MKHVAEFADHCFLVLDALCEMEATDCGVFEPDLSLDFSEMRVTYAFIVFADTLDSAAQEGTNYMRSAVHEAERQYSKLGRSRDQAPNCSGRRIERGGAGSYLCFLTDATERLPKRTDR